VTAEASGDQAASSGAAPPPRPGPALPGEVPGAEVFHVNLRELRSGYPDKDMRLLVGDTVYFPKAAQVYVTGHVARPGAFFIGSLLVHRWDRRWMRGSANA